MNPNAAHSINPIRLAESVYKNRDLIYDLIKREISGRYQGSMLGLMWSFFNPLMTLAVYTFVFSVVFQARWQGGNGSKIEFAMALFVGLMSFNLFSECLSKAPGLVISNVNYVKKVIFPLEILPIVSMGSALFHLLVSAMVWVSFYLIFFGAPSILIIVMPIVFLPFILMTLGFSWLLASLGVYIRDVGQVIGIFVTMLMFLSPIFYPVSALPEVYWPYVSISPLTFVVEQSRSVMIWGGDVDMQGWALWLMTSAVIAFAGFAWFQKTRKGFPDVL